LLRPQDVDLTQGMACPYRCGQRQEQSRDLDEPLKSK
jgi:hypothetical protein